MSRTWTDDQLWYDYEQRKRTENRDPGIFSPNHPWELTYLIRIIRQHYKEYSESAVFTAIRNVSKALPRPHRREEFVQAVLKELLQRQSCATYPGT